MTFGDIVTSAFSHKSVHCGHLPSGIDTQQVRAFINTICLTHWGGDKMAGISADDIFKCIFMNEKFCTSIPISLKFVIKGPIDSNSALVQVMAWRRSGDKPLSEPMVA